MAGLRSALRAPAGQRHAVVLVVPVVPAERGTPAGEHKELEGAWGRPALQGYSSRTATEPCPEHSG